MDNHNMSKLILKNLPVILEKVIEDDDSQLKLSREIGKIAFCLHRYHPSVFFDV